MGMPSKAHVSLILSKMLTTIRHANWKMLFNSIFKGRKSAPCKLSSRCEIGSHYDSSQTRKAKSKKAGLEN